MWNTTILLPAYVSAGAASIAFNVYEWLLGFFLASAASTLVYLASAFHSSRDPSNAHELQLMVTLSTVTSTGGILSVPHTISLLRNGKGWKLALPHICCAVLAILVIVFLNIGQKSLEAVQDFREYEGVTNRINYLISDSGILRIAKAEVPIGGYTMRNISRFGAFLEQSGKSVPGFGTLVGGKVCQLPEGTNEDLRLAGRVYCEGIEVKCRPNGLRNVTLPRDFPAVNISTHAAYDTKDPFELVVRRNNTFDNPDTQLSLLLRDISMRSHTLLFWEGDQVNPGNTSSLYKTQTSALMFASALTELEVQAAPSDLPRLVDRAIPNATTTFCGQPTCPRSLTLTPDELAALEKRHGGDTYILISNDINVPFLFWAGTCQDRIVNGTYTVQDGNRLIPDQVTHLPFRSQNPEVPLSNPIISTKLEGTNYGAVSLWNSPEMKNLTVTEKIERLREHQQAAWLYGVTLSASIKDDADFDGTLPRSALEPLKLPAKTPIIRMRLNLLFPLIALLFVLVICITTFTIYIVIHRTLLPSRRLAAEVCTSPRGVIWRTLALEPGRPVSSMAPGKMIEDLMDTKVGFIESPDGRSFSVQVKRSEERTLMDVREGNGNVVDKWYPGHSHMV